MSSSYSSTSSSSTTTNDESSLLWYAAGSAAIAMGCAIALLALENDTISRKFILQPDQVLTKRAKEYTYRWQRTLERAELKLQYYLNSKSSSTFTEEGNDNVEVLLTTESEIQEFVKNLVNNNNNNNKQMANIRIGRIGKDRTNADIREHFVWLYADTNDNNNNATTTYQIPCGLLGRILKEVMEDMIWTGAFCFIADASANMASNFICDIVAASTSAEDIAIVSQPYWMTCLAVLLQQNVYSNDTIHGLLYGLCRLEAWRLTTNTTGNSSSSSSSSSNHNSKKKGPHTILVTVPTGLVPTLLPALQETFPADRHIFAYTGCVQTVHYAAAQRRSYTTKTKIPETLDEALTMNYRTKKNPNDITTTTTTTSNSSSSDPVTYTTPLVQRQLHKSIHITMTEKLTNALTNLPIEQADVVETWMNAVNSFFALKHAEIAASKRKNSKNARIRQEAMQHTKNTELYVPYVFKLDLVLCPEPPYLSVRSLLQYVLGSKSRELPTECMDAAISWLHDYHTAHNAQWTDALKYVQMKTNPVTKSIENVVFQHKLILIANKVLQDTVLPAQQWTMKNAVKSGCACCPPDEEEDDEEEERFNADNNSSSNARLAGLDVLRGGATTTTTGSSNGVVGAFATVNTNTTTTTTTNNDTSSSTAGGSSSAYVDGKMGFAFDPSRFAASEPKKSAATASAEPPKAAATTTASTSQTTATKSSSSNSGFVDGKMGFAFDPSRFS